MYIEVICQFRTDTLCSLIVVPASISRDYVSRISGVPLIKKNLSYNSACDFMAAPSSDPRQLQFADHDADANSTFEGSEAATETPMRNPAEARLHRKDIQNLIDLAAKYTVTYKHT